MDHHLCRNSGNVSWEKRADKQFADCLQVTKVTRPHAPDQPLPADKERACDELKAIRIAEYVGLTEDQVKRFVECLLMVGLEIVPTTPTVPAPQPSLTERIDEQSPSEDI